MAFTVPTKVNAGTRTSSSFFTPRTLSEIKIACVPLTTAIANLDFENFLILFSNLFTYSPAVDTKFFLIVSFTNLISLPLNKGSWSWCGPLPITLDIELTIFLVVDLIEDVDKMLDFSLAFNQYSMIYF